MLLSYIYKPVTTKKYKYGIVTHFDDYEYFKQFETPECPVINMGMAKDSEQLFYELIDKINECEFVFSSSLHGLIFSHSLGIPAVHLENKMLYSKDNFKFKDYYSTLNIDYKKYNMSDSPDLAAIATKKTGCLPSKKILKHLQQNVLSEIQTFVEKTNGQLPIKYDTKAKEAQSIKAYMGGGYYGL